jgi:hypothetical protein
MCRSLTSLQLYFLESKNDAAQDCWQICNRKCSKFKPLPFFDSGRSGSIIHFLLTIWKKLQTSNPSYGEGVGWGGVSRSIIHFLLILMTQLLMNLSWPLGTLMLAFPSWVGYCPSWEKRGPLIKSAMKWVGRWAGKYKRTIGGYKWTVIVHIGFPPVLGDYLVWWCRTKDSCSSY